MKAAHSRHSYTRLPDSELQCHQSTDSASVTIQDSLKCIDSYMCASLNFVTSAINAYSMVFTAHVGWRYMEGCVELHDGFAVSLYWCTTRVVTKYSSFYLYPIPLWFLFYWFPLGDQLSINHLFYLSVNVSHFWCSSVFPVLCALVNCCVDS